MSGPSAQVSKKSPDYRGQNAPGSKESPDYRGPQEVVENVTSDYRSNNKSYRRNKSVKPVDYIVSNKSSYASITDSSYPSKEQGIMCECREDLILDDYLDAINLISPVVSNIATAFKTNNTYKIFFKNKELCQNFIGTNPALSVKQQAIPIIPLVTPFKKIYLSNVNPRIPNQAIEECLKNFKIRQGAPVEHLKASSKYKTVTTNRRITYIHPDDTENLPPIIRLHYQGEINIIFADTENFICFNCNQEGHLARYCPGILDQQSRKHSPQEPLEPPQNDLRQVQHQPTEGDTNEEIKQKTEIRNVNQTQNETMIIEETVHKTGKRNFSDLSSEISSTLANLPNDDRAKMPPPKKIIKANAQKSTPARQVTLEGHLQPIKELLNKPESLMNYVTFKSFLENMQGAKNPREIAAQYHDKLEDIREMIFFLRGHVTSRGIKGRFTRIRNALAEDDNTSEIDYSSGSATESETEG